MSTQTVPPSSGRRSTSSVRRGPSASKKPVQSDNGSVNGSVNGNTSKPNSPPAPPLANGERTVKKLRLSKALTIPEGTTVSDACRRMAARRVDAVLLTDANALLSGIVTDKDIATRVIAEGLRPEQTTVSKVMTRNPIFVTADSLAIEALQKMVQGKFRHLPVVENGEVIALLDITKCLYDAISRMEKAAEQGSALAAAVEGVERQWGSGYSAPYAFIETLRERMFKPALSTIITETSKVALVSPSDPVYVAAKKMREFRVNSVVITIGNKVQGILTSKDILMRVVAQNLSPELTLVEKVMTPNPECAALETTILDALHIMHDGKFLHLPVLDKDGSPAACVDVLQITHAAISMVENSTGAVNDMANTMMQKFWDSALALEPQDDFDTHSEMSAMMHSDGAETGKQSFLSVGLGNSFAFKFEDLKGRVHRVTSAPENLEELMTMVMQRIGNGDDNNLERPQLLYEDDEGDKVLITADGDLTSAVTAAKSAGKKVLRLHLDFTESTDGQKGNKQMNTTESTSGGGGWVTWQAGVVAGGVAVMSIGGLIYLKRSKI
ncbi:PREDICTED: CBS domain-containing protein CBSCBSPB3 [Tarenaya hassleriana]|uniref:CBS domain-containing protein CBSCBSPB3 n=1 Tax=Tarenaya hassleriana TaxID=28532 RepID=UPI00053C52E0|nr:PREDICTED: CBS domain-containing protein CBSCBSPB3 [Tarenaya hassleriana]